MFRKTFVTALLSAALALGPTVAAPALAQDRSDRDDAARIIAGAIAAGVIANALRNQNVRGTTRTEYWPRVDNRRWRYDDRRGRHGYRHRDRSRFSLPAHCQFTAVIGGQRQRVFGENCLQRAGYRPNALPRNCTLPYRARGSWYTVFQSRCLRHNGYRVEARRRR